MRERVLYHRAYKKVEATDTSVLVRFFALVLLIDILIIKFHPDLTRAISSFCAYILKAAGYEPTIVLTDWALLYEKIYLTDLQATYPAPVLSAAVFFLSIMAMLILPRVKRIPKPIAIWLGFLCFINLVSATFFIFIPHLFPYSTLIFSDLYMKTEIGIWLFIPVLLGMALHPIPRGITEKFALILAVEIYSIAFAAVRYTVFLYIFRELSVLFMAVLFFAFGPLFDFVYVVGSYSVYTSWVAKKLSKRTERWRWLF